MEFRRPRPDTPILPQNAIFRREPIKPFKRPKGRRGKKPRGAKLKPRNLSQFNKFHTEAARNKERDRAETERIDKIKERDDARRDRTDRLLVEDRRYAAKVITDARDRAAERGFRAEQLRLLRQQAAAPPPALPPPPVINIAPAPVNIAPAQIDVRPVINIPPAQQPPLPQVPRGVAAYQQGGGRAAPVEMTPAEQQEARDRIYAGLVGQPPPDAIPRWAAAQLDQERQRREQAETGLDAERRNRLAITDRARQEIAAEQGLRGQAERDRDAAARAVEEATQEAQEVRQREVEALRIAAERQRQAEGLQTQLSALERQRSTERDVRGEERGEAEQELTEQVARAQRNRNLERDRADDLDRQRLAAEERATALQSRAEELEAHNQVLQRQRQPAVIAPMRDGSQVETQEDRDNEIVERFSDQYQGLILRQSSRQQRNDPAFNTRLGEFMDRVEEGQGNYFPIRREGDGVPEADKPFYIKPFRPENEEFLRRQLAQERILRGVGNREGTTFTHDLVESELETIRQLERDEQRRRLGRGQPTPPVIEFRAGELTDSQVRRDLPFEQPENPFELVRQGSSGLSVASTGSQAEEAIEQRIDELEEEQRLDLGGLDFTPEPEPASAPAPFVKRQKPKPRTVARPEGVAPLDPAIPAARERNRLIDEEAAAAALSQTSSLESFEDPWETVSASFEGGDRTTFSAKGKPDNLDPSKTHFTFKDEGGYVGGKGTRGRFQGQDLVLLDLNPKNQNVKVRTRESVNKKVAGGAAARKDIEGNIKFDFFQELVNQGEIQLTPINHELQELGQQREAQEPSLAGQAVGAVGGAVASAGGVIGNAALGAARGASQAVYDRLPTAGDVGEAAGRGVVAAASGVAGVVRGGIRAATSPRIGEQTGGVARGLVETESSDSD